MISLLHGRIMIQGTGLPFYKTILRHDISAAAPPDDADIGGGIIINASQLHGRNRLCCHRNRIDPLFRCQRSVCRLAGNIGNDPDACRCSQHSSADLTVRIQHIGLSGTDPVVIKTLGTLYKIFLTGGKNDLHIPVRKIITLDLTNSL